MKFRKKKINEVGNVIFKFCFTLIVYYDFKHNPNRSFKIIFTNSKQGQIYSIKHYYV